MDVKKLAQKNIYISIALNTTSISVRGDTEALCQPRNLKTIFH